MTASLYPLTALLLLAANPASAAEMKFETEERARWSLRAFLRNGFGLYLPGASVAVDSQCNFYVGGRTAPDSAPKSLKRSCYLVKLDRGARALWTREFANTVDVHVSTGGGSGVFIAGSFTNEVQVGPHRLTSPTGRSVFTAKFDDGGNVVWVRQADAGRSLFLSGLAANRIGEVVVYGKYGYEGMAFENISLPGSFNASGAGSLFIAKHDANGRLLWAKSDGPGSANSRDCAIDSAGNVYFTGCFYRQTQIAGRVMTAPEYVSEFFLAKYDSGGRAAWVTREGNSGGNLGARIGLDPSGNIHVSGVNMSERIFAGISYPLESRYLSNSFVAVFNPKGEFQSVRQFRRGDFDFSNTICVDLAKRNVPGPWLTAARNRSTNSQPAALSSAATLPNTSVSDLKSGEGAAAGGHTPGAEGAPMLRAERAGEHLLLRWAKTSAHFEVEGTDTIMPFPLWQPVAHAPEEISGEMTMRIPLDRAAAFYRLRKR